MGTTMSSVYLAGPITGLSYSDSVSWHHEAMAALKDVGIQSFSPLRAKKAALPSLDYISDKFENSFDPLISASGIMGRDFFDVNRCDLIIANFLHAKRISIGTVMECAWAYQMHKIVIAIANPDDLHVTHAMMERAITYRVDNLDHALEIAKAVLLTDI